MACGFKTPHGLKIYLGIDYFLNFALENNNYNNSKDFEERISKIPRKIEFLYELPRCLSVYLLASLLLLGLDFSFFTSFLLFLGIKLVGCYISRIHICKPLYCFLCIVALPFQLISFNFYLPYIVLGIYAFFSNQAWLLLSYFVAFLVFYIFDMILSIPFVMSHTKKKYGIAFLGSELSALNVFYNELDAVKFMNYKNFIKDYCEWMNYEPVTYV